MPTLRGTGFLPDPAETVAADLTRRPLLHEDPNVGLIGSTLGLVRERSWMDLLDEVKDQGPTSSCTAQFLSSAVYLAGQTAVKFERGPEVERPSVLWSYGVARMQGAPKAPLVDNGARPTDLMQGAQEHGLIAESRLPFDPRDINVELPLDGDMAGADALLLGYYVQGEDGAFDALCAALEAGHFPGLAIDVYDNFRDPDTSKPYELTQGFFSGGHMLTAVGYRRTGDGSDGILILNSWGPDWGNDGTLWLSRAFVESRHVKYRVVVTAAPSSR